MTDTDAAWCSDRIAASRKAAVTNRAGPRLPPGRDIMGWPLEDLANARGHDPVRLEDYEAGRCRIPPGDLAGIARVLQIPVIWFFVGLGSAEPAAPAATDQP